jgi:hypothetical protein
MRYLFNFFALVLVCLLGLASVEAAAQPEATVVFAAQQADRIAFVMLSESGKRTPLGELPPEFHTGEPDTSSNWFIDDPSSYISPSPDRTMIAFTAQRGEKESRLFLYAVARQRIVQQIDIPIWHEPVWSPDGSAILLKFYYWPYTSGAMDYVYEIAKDQLHALDSEKQDAFIDQWLPDSSGLLFDDVNLSTVARDGHTDHPLRKLTDVYSQIPEDDADRNICETEWSAVNKRYYYVVGCVGGADIPTEYIYSVDLAGHNHKETLISLPKMYPDETFIDVRSILPSPDKKDVYIVVSSMPVEERMRMRILRLDKPGKFTTVYEEASDHEFQFARMSPNGKHIALLNTPGGSPGHGDGAIRVIQLETGKLIASIDIAPQQICSEDAQWLGSTKLVYTVDPDVYCYPGVSKQPIHLWQLDVTTGVSSLIEENLDGQNWLLPVTMIGGVPVVASGKPKP